MTALADEASSERVVLDHGTGAGLSRALLEVVFDELGDVSVGEQEDSAILDLGTSRVAFSTDSFVVDPPFFGNGDVGKIAVCGTVNDLAVMGAEPRYLSLGLILETGLPMARLRQALRSVRDAAREAEVLIAAGDTKVVRAGEADGIYINTTGIGVLNRPPLRMADVRAGDRIILSAPIGAHTVHLLSVREGLGFETRVLSDCAPLNGLIGQVLDTVGSAVHSIRDVTRGGLAGILHEYADKLAGTVAVDYPSLPIGHETAMAMDMLGIDAINAANEGCLCLFVDPGAVGAVLDTLRAHHYGRQAVVVGEVETVGDGAQVIVTDDNGRRRLTELRGAELPRLC